MKQDSHLAWNVKYTPGAIEARGYKGGKQVMTARRETTGPAAKLVLTADRKEISADGEDVAMFAVEVQDAQGRYLPIADNQVNFRVSGQGKVIGVGNGDPTSHESDKGSSRKAFSGLCMALVQSSKAAGNLTVEASSPGLTPASVTISAKAVKLRPQVAVWEREVPAGAGITGLWRPAPVAAAAGRGGGGFGGGGNQVFSFRQNGNALGGTVEGGGGGRGGGWRRHAHRDRRWQGGWRQHLLQRRWRCLHRNAERRPRSSFSGPAAPPWAAEEDAAPRPSLPDRARLSAHRRTVRTRRPRLSSVLLRGGAGGRGGANARAVILHRAGR